MKIDKEIESEVIAKLRWIAQIQLISGIGILISIISAFWGWDSWWKLLLTSIVLFAVIGFVYNFLKEEIIKQINARIDEEIFKRTGVRPKSEFQRKLELMGKVRKEVQRSYYDKTNKE